MSNWARCSHCGEVVALETASEEQGGNVWIHQADSTYACAGGNADPGFDPKTEEP